MYMCIHADKHVCICVCIYTYLYIYIYIYIYIYPRVRRSKKKIYIYIYIYIYISANVHAYTNIIYIYIYIFNVYATPPPRKKNSSLTHTYPPTLPSTCQGRAAPGTTVGVERCFSLTYLLTTFRRTLLVSRLCRGISNVTRCVCIRCSMAKMFPGALTDDTLPGFHCFAAL